MRAFIALDLPDQIKDQIQKTSASLQLSAPRCIKWVEPENLHITFLFLGEIARSHLEDIAQILEMHAANLQGLTFEKPHLQLIKPNNPRILWISYYCNSEELIKAHHRSAKAIQQIGYKLDRKPLKYHVTMARIKGKLSQQFIDAVVKMKLPQTSFKVPRLTLYESILKPQGPIYNPVFSIDL